MKITSVVLCRGFMTFYSSWHMNLPWKSQSQSLFHAPQGSSTFQSRSCFADLLSSYVCLSIAHFQLHSFRCNENTEGNRKLSGVLLRQNGMQNRKHASCIFWSWRHLDGINSCENVVRTALRPLACGYLWLGSSFTQYCSACWLWACVLGFKMVLVSRNTVSLHYGSSPENSALLQTTYLIK